MLDDVAIRQPVISKARNINLMSSPAATREADIGFPRLAGAVDDTADDGNRHRNVDMLQPFLDDLHCLDDVELLARAFWLASVFWTAAAFT